MRRRLGGVLGIALLASAIAFVPATNAKATNIETPVKLRKIASGLDSPVALAWRGSDGRTIYVAQQSGSIVTVRRGVVDPDPVLKLDVSSGGERGLLGIVFSNDGSKLYVDYTDPTGDIQVVEYTMATDGSNVADPSTARPLLTIPHRTFANHNGGDLAMDSHGMLYISVGDGGGGGDSLHNGQNKNSLLAKILRIYPKPSGSMPYQIPPHNPFVGKLNARPETWMWGLRNPWRFSLDRLTRDMWIGDVGQNAYEEIDFAKAREKGINWGWPLREGKHPYDGPPPPGARDPIIERPHAASVGGVHDCAIIGGYVYRGRAIQGFQGAYVFGDACTGRLRAIKEINGKPAHRRDLRLTVPSLSSFGEGPAGELFALSLQGDLYRLVPG